MQAKLHILKASGRLHDFEQRIISAYKDTIEKVSKVLELPNIDIVVSDNPDSAIPETGAGGYYASPSSIFISINPNHKDLNNSLEKEIASTIAHEVNHCVRDNAVGYGKTLLEAVVSEGIADHFDIEINDGNPKPWSVALTDSKLDMFLEKAKSDFDNKNYNHSEWFFGSEDKNIPRWTGYSIGFNIVKDYLKKSGKKSSELASVPAVEFIEK